MQLPSLCDAVGKGVGLHAACMNHLQPDQTITRKLYVLFLDNRFLYVFHAVFAMHVLNPSALHPRCALRSPAETPSVRRESPV